jgi:hypothetical protein
MKLLRAISNDVANTLSLLHAAIAGKEAIGNSGLRLRYSSGHMQGTVTAQVARDETLEPKRWLAENQVQILARLTIEEEWIKNAE